jgi:hypothetical protein
MDQLDLDDLIAAMREVAAASNPDADSDLDPNDDPDNSDDPNGDPDDDAGDPLDDPRSYVNDDDSDDDAYDFSTPRRVRTVMLLEKLREEERLNDNRRLVAIRSKPTAPSKVAQNATKLRNLQGKTAAIHAELASSTQVATAQKAYEAASLDLHRASRTREDKLEHEHDMRRMAKAYSSVCAEVHPE